MIETYEKINKDLKNAVNHCIQFYSQNPEELNRMLTAQQNGNWALDLENRENRLIQWNHRLREIKKQYSSRDWLTGELGTIEEIDQIDGITNLALLAVCANRIAKFPHGETIGEQKRTRNAYRIKSDSISSLLASLFVLNETSEEFHDFFSYGNRLDEQENDTFILDLPYFGQICLHYGSPKKKEAVLYDACQKAHGILKRKCELDQISQEDLAKIQITNDKILPQYTGKLYEYSAGFPLEKEINIDRFREELGLNNVLPEEITQKHIEKMSKYPVLNHREKNYMAIKLGFSKRQIEELLLYIDPFSEINKLRVGLRTQDKSSQGLVARKIGQSSLKETTVEERKIVQNTLERGIANDTSLYK